MNKPDLQSKKILWIIIGFFVFYKLITFRMFDIGGDAANYWFAAKLIYYGFPYGEITHQTSRFGIILPVYLSQLIFGVHPAVTAIFPNVLLLIQVIFIYKIGSEIYDIRAGFISAILFMMCPSVIKWSSQILPPAFEGPALTMSFYFILKYGEKKIKEIGFLTLAAFMLFWAYTAKETSIYLMPAFMSVIFMMKKNVRHMLIFSGMLLFLFIMECAIFYYFTGDFMARLHSITGIHMLQEKLFPISFCGLFKRYTGAPFYWRIPLIIYLGMLIPVIRSGSVKVRGVAISGLVYYLLILFSVKSVNPIIPAMPFKDQYLVAGLPFLIPVIVIGFLNLYEMTRNGLQESKREKPAMRSVKAYAIIAVSLSLLIFIVSAAMDFSGKKFPYYTDMYNNLFKINEHNVVKIFKNYTLLNEAYANNIPIVSDYHYTVDDLKIYEKIQEILKSRRALDKACVETGITTARYRLIRPGMSLKNLNIVYKVFLRVSPQSLPEPGTVTIGRRIYGYLIKPDISMYSISSKLAAGRKVLFAGSDVFDVYYGRIED